MKKINKTIITLASCVLPLTMVIPAITSCNKKTSEISLDTSGVEKKVTGYVANVIGTTQDIIFKGFKYTGPSDLNISATLTNVVWSGTYSQPKVINKTDNSFDLEVNLVNPEGLYAQTGSCDLKIKLNDKEYDVKGFNIEFVTSDVLCIADIESNIIPTQQASTTKTIGIVVLMYKNRRVVTDYSDFYVDVKTKTQTKSRINWYLVGASEIGQCAIVCDADTIPASGESFDITINVKNRKLEKLGVSWSATFETTITISTKIEDMFSFGIRGSGASKYAALNYIKSTDAKVVIPETCTVDGETYPVKQIGWGEGHGNTTTTEIVLPKNMDTFQPIIFSPYRNLEKISINGVEEGVENNGFYTKANCLIKHEGNEYKLVCATTNTNKVPDEVTIIEGEGIAEKYITNLEIGPNVKEFTFGWFENIPTLKSFKVNPANKTFSSQINGVERNALFGKSDSAGGFDTLYRAYDITPDIPNDGGIKFIGSRAYNRCTTKTSITLPNTVEEIGNTAFSGCYNLKEFTIPEKVKKIETRAFENCYSLQQVNIPSSLNMISSEAFSECYNLSKINWVGQDFANCKIYGGAFYGCTSITDVTIGKNITLVENPFIGCTNIKSLQVEDGHPTYASKFDVETNCIVETATGKIVSGCNVSKIPENVNVKGISQFAFAELDFEEFTIPANINWISARSFDRCSHLSTLYVLGDGTWKSYTKDDEEAGSGTDVTAAIKDPSTALSTLEAAGFRGHISRSNP